MYDEAEWCEDCFECNGTQTLTVKGMSKTLKRGDKIKNIRTIDNPQNIECRIGKSLLVIKTQFIKRV